VVGDHGEDVAEVVGPASEGCGIPPPADRGRVDATLRGEAVLRQLSGFEQAVE